MAEGSQERPEWPEHAHSAQNAGAPRKAEKGSEDVAFRISVSEIIIV